MHYIFYQTHPQNLTINIQNIVAAEIRIQIKMKSSTVAPENSQLLVTNLARMMAERLTEKAQFQLDFFKLILIIH